MIGKIINNYRVVNHIGEGGMGVVYLAEHLTLGRKAAIKSLSPHLVNDNNLRQRFQNEAIALSVLNHPNIVTLYDFISSPDSLFIIMEYVEGKNLAEYLSTNGKLYEPTALKIFKGILNAFAYAHSNGIIHRDIKPSNIILTSSGVPKILDFGIAKIISSDSNRITKTGTRMGSVSYMSPEQILGKEIDIRSDIYSLGILLFEMLSARLPFDSDAYSEYEIQSRIINDPMPRIKDFNSSISDKAVSIINKATEKDPANRYQSCDSIISDLESNSNISQQSVTKIIDPVSAINATRNYELKYNEPEKDKSPLALYITLSAIASLLLIILIYLLFDNYFTQDKEILSKVNNKPDTVEKIKQIETPPEKKPIERTPKYGTQSEINAAKDDFYNWINCWQSMDLNCYISHISNDYVYESPTGNPRIQNYSKRISTLQRQFSEKSWITITTSDVKVSVIDDIATIRYYQVYSSSNYNDNGYKEVKLRKVNGNWKIFSDKFYTPN